MKLKCTLIIFFTLLVSNAYSQSCRNKLQEASNLYSEGLIDEIPSMLKPCMKEGFNRIESIEAYKLIILAYLFDDNQIEAEKVMTEFLKKYPEYELMPNDPVEFEYLFNTYKTTSFLSIGLLAGSNFCFPGMQKIYTPFDAGRISNTIQPGTGFQIGVGASFPMAKGLTVAIDFFYSINSYQHTTQSELWLESGRILQSKVSIDEQIQRFDIPLTFTYNFGQRNLSYFLRAGGMFGLNLSNTGVVSQEYNRDMQSIATDDYDFSAQRNMYNVFAVAGGGLRYKVSRGYIILDLRYNAGLANQTQLPREDEFLSTRYEFIHSDHVINAVAFSLGYEYSFYRSKKK